MSDEQRKTEAVPAAALRFTIGEFELGDNGEDSKTAPFRMVARSGQPIEHWYWGSVVHDLDGVRLNGRNRIPIDYAHDEKEVIGYANHFDTGTGDLVATGALVPFGKSDRATEIIHKQKNGVPYEASINFGGDGIQIERLSEGQTTTVNGRQFSGPGTIIRQWPLRGIAVCPYGADGNTSTEFSTDDKVNVEVRECEMSDEQVKQENEQPELEASSEAVEDVQEVETDIAAEAAEESAAVEAEPVAVEMSAPSEGQRFLDAFGDKGGVWFAQGKTFAEAQELFTADLIAERDELRSRLDAIQSDGEVEPVKFSESKPPKAKNKLIRFRGQQ